MRFPFLCVQMVAVKQLARDGVQGRNEFLVEVLMLTVLNHRNLVSLVGFCAQGDERLLVYEYMPFGSLESHLFGKLSTLYSSAFCGSWLGNVCSVLLELVSQGPVHFFRRLQISTGMLAYLFAFDLWQFSAFSLLICDSKLL